MVHSLLEKDVYASKCKCDTVWQVKRAGSRLKSRIVAEQSTTKWSQMIEQMEDQVAEILQEERFLNILTLTCILLNLCLLFQHQFGFCREEMALRKAEMEAAKVNHLSFLLVSILIFMRTTCLFVVYFVKQLT